MIKIYSDGANISEMREVYKQGLVKGFTTNPTLMRKAGVRNYKKFVKDCVKEFPDVPISFEVFADEEQEIYQQAVIISEMGENIYVKIPITNTKQQSHVSIIDTLLSQKIKLNITAVFTQSQIDEILPSLSNHEETPVVVSVFAGRIADTGTDPIPLMRSYSRYFQELKSCELLWASSREVLNIYQAQECGCDIITATPSLIKKISLKGKDLEDFSLDTVKMFFDDAKSAGYVL